MGTMFFLQAFVDGILQGTIYSMIAIAFVLIYKCSKILNLAQGGLVLLGAYFSYSLMVQFHLPFWLSVILAIFFVSLVGLLFERFPLRPLIGQPILSIIMATIGIDVLIRGVCILVWGTRGWRKYPKVFEIMPVKLFSLYLSRQHLYIFLCTIVLLGLLLIFFKKHRTGLVMRAVAEGHMVAQSMGIKVSSVIAIAWMVSGMISAVSGVFLGSIINVNVGLTEIALKALPAAIVGGLESIPGAVIGGLLIGVAGSISGTYVGHGISEIAPFVVMMLILIIKPQGLLGLEIIERV